MSIRGGKPPVQDENPYQPAQPAPLVMEKFQGIQTSTSRPGVADEQCYWIDGFMPIGPNFLRTLYDVGDKLWTAPTTMTMMQFCNIGSTQIMMAILGDGSIWQVLVATGVAQQIAAAGTITNPDRRGVDITQYGSQLIIIVALQTNGYFIWDGGVFYVPGGVAPLGGLMPTAVGGNSVEMYAGRVWIASNSSIIFSAPGSVNDFSTGSGGGSFSSTDSFLKVRFSQLKQTNGFLYLVADSSINYISGVQTTGSPPSTTFTNQNADPEVGTPWPSSVTVFGRNIVFANAFGAHVSYGAAVTKISEALDGVYGTVPNFGGIVPSAAKAIIFGKRVWMLLLPIIDPVTGQQVNKLLMWNGTIWWASEQSIPLVYIAYQEIDSVISAWGTNGLDVYPLFNTPSVDFTKTVQSRLWEMPGGIQFIKTAGRLWGSAIFYTDNENDITIRIDNETDQSSAEIEAGPGVMTWFNDSGAVITWTNASGDVIDWSGSGTGLYVFEPTAIGQQGMYLGMTASTDCDDLAIVTLKIQPEVQAYRG